MLRLDVCARSLANRRQRYEQTVVLHCAGLPRRRYVTDPPAVLTLDGLLRGDRPKLTDLVGHSFFVTQRGDFQQNQIVYLELSFFSTIIYLTYVEIIGVQTYHQAYYRAVHHTLPTSRLYPSCSTRLLAVFLQDCDNSSLPPRDFRQDKMHNSLRVQFFREENPTSTLDTSFHSQSCSTFPRTQSLAQSVYILHNVNIHKLNLLQSSNAEPSCRYRVRRDIEINSCCHILVEHHKL